MMYGSLMLALDTAGLKQILPPSDIKRSAEELCTLLRCAKFFTFPTQSGYGYGHSGCNIGNEWVESIKNAMASAPSGGFASHVEHFRG